MKAYKLIAIILAGLFLLCACEKQETPPADNPSESNPAPSDTIEPATEATEELTEDPTKLPSITFEIEQIGTYENIEEEFAEYQIYYVPKEPYYLKEKIRSIADDIHKSGQTGNYACIIEGTDNIGFILKIGLNINHNYDFIVSLYAFGCIYDLTHAETYFGLARNTGIFYITDQTILFSDLAGQEVYLIYENGYQKIWADEKNHTIGTEATKELYFSVKDNVIYYYRYNEYYVDEIRVQTDGSIFGEQHSGVLDFMDLNDEEIATEFMLEYGTIALIDGIPELQPIQTYTIKEWSHSEFSPYAQQLIEYNCEINELWNILNNK